MAKHTSETGSPINENLTQKGTSTFKANVASTLPHNSIHLVSTSSEEACQIKECVERLHKFYAATEPPFIPGDDLGTTFESTGAVLLASCFLHSKSSPTLVAATGLPVAFIKAVLFVIEVEGLWDSDSAVDLVQLLVEPLHQDSDVSHALHSLLEELWDGLANFQMASLLTVLRGRKLFGGKRQTWIDVESEGLQVHF